MEDGLFSVDSPKEKAHNKMIFFIIIIVVLLIVSIVFAILYIVEVNKNDDDDDDVKPIPKKGLTLWNECNAKKKLVEFVEKVTNETSKEDFIAKEDRIAIFDLDGTLFQETDLVYNDYKIYKYRVLDDPDYKDKATDFQKEVEKEIEQFEKGEPVEGLDLRHARANAEVFAEMSLEDYDKYVKDFLSKPADGYNNMTRGEAFYKPMLEVIDYLQDNDFLIYICSGTDRFTVRAAIDGKINIPKGNVIGTESLVIGNKQGNTSYFNYTYHQDEYLMYKGEFVVKNLYMYKVYHIIREIGKIPILSFGNSNGDSSMANFVMSRKQHPGLAFMLLCDDTIRENGNITKAQKMNESCIENNWIPVSMKNDWKTIYGDNVTRKNNTY